MVRRSVTRIEHGAWALCLVALTPTAQAHVRGTTGRSTRGCGAVGSCHGAGAGASATIVGPLAVAPGSRTTYTLTLQSALADFVAGGCDLSASGATLAAAPAQSSTRLAGAEIVQSAALARSAGTALEVRFDVIAPSAPGVVTLSAAGNAVNLNQLATGDAWAVASLRVVVGDPPSDAAAPEDGADGEGAGDADPFAGDAPLAFDASRSMAYGQCATTPGARRGGVEALAVMALAALARRRRTP